MKRKRRTVILGGVMMEILVFLGSGSSEIDVKAGIDSMTVSR